QSFSGIATYETPLVGFATNPTAQARMTLGMPVSGKLLTPLGLVALILGILGLYGVITYSVSQRTYEIGIRMALGASNREVLRMVLLQGLRPSIIAAVAGLTLAFSVQPLLDTPEFSYVNPRDPTVYAGVLLLILFVTAVACYIPARRASLVDPNVTLRDS